MHNDYRVVLASFGFGAIVWISGMPFHSCLFHAMPIQDYYLVATPASGTYERLIRFIAAPSLFLSLKARCINDRLSIVNYVKGVKRLRGEGAGDTQIV